METHDEDRIHYAKKFSYFLLALTVLPSEVPCD